MIDYLQAVYALDAPALALAAVSIACLLLWHRTEMLERECEQYREEIATHFEAGYELQGELAELLTRYEHEVCDHDLTRQALRVQTRRVEDLTSEENAMMDEFIDDIPY